LRLFDHISLNLRDRRNIRRLEIRFSQPNFILPERSQCTVTHRSDSDPSGVMVSEVC
jgi:hypothetical protein